MSQFATLLEEVQGRKPWSSSELHRRAVENTPGSRADAEELEIESERRQHPDQAGQTSIRTGVFWQPAGSLNKYPYNGKNGYGGLDQIRRKLRFRNPLFVKGSTGGRAPQLAYDQVKGKGSYAAMRSAVLGAVLQAQPHLLPEKVYNILDEFGGDTSVYDDIVQVSRRAGGNNLAYAVQENIVANAVREAGYDAIVGYSVKRDGTPFLSEVFDLNSREYPDPQESAAS